MQLNPTAKDVTVERQGSQAASAGEVGVGRQASHGPEMLCTRRPIALEDLPTRAVLTGLRPRHEMRGIKPGVAVPASRTARPSSTGDPAARQRHGADGWMGGQGWARSQVRSAPTSRNTHILVVADPAASRDFWVNVLGAALYREYGGTSVVLKFAGMPGCCW